LRALDSFVLLEAILVVLEERRKEKGDFEDDEFEGKGKSERRPRTDVRELRLSIRVL